ncbi:MAG: hypothetical protein M5U01_42495 [Ardenticatenaceae bacterium]|nr:hypothetical protein [Ardenticatenaceae bacterium]
MRSHTDVVRWSLIGILTLAVTLVYGWALSGYFLGDDLSFLYYVAEWARQNRLGPELLGEFASTMLNSAGFFFRPLYIASFAGDYLMWGTNAAGWHLTNLLLHLANALLLWRLVERLLARPGSRTAMLAGAAAAILFALRPTGPEVVIWLSGRTDSLALFGLLIGLLAYLRADGRWGNWYLLALGGFLLALGGKEAGVTLPGGLVALHLVGAISVRRRPGESRWLAWARGAFLGVGPFALLLLVYLGWRQFLFGSPFTVYLGVPPIRLDDPDWRARKLWALIFFLMPGLRITALPLFAGLVTGAQGLVGLLVARRSAVARRVWVFGVLWLMATLLPLAQQINIEASGLNARLLYIPAAPLAILLAVPFAALVPPERRRRTQADSLALAGALGTVILTLVWIPLLLRLLDPWVEAGRSMRALPDAISARAAAVPEGGFAILLIPDNVRGVHFARNGQGALMSPPVQGRVLATRVLVLTPPPFGELTPEMGAFLLPAPAREHWCWNATAREFEPLAFPEQAKDVWRDAMREAGCTLAAAQ